MLFTLQIGKTTYNFKINLLTWYLFPDYYKSERFTIIKFLCFKLHIDRYSL